MEEKAVPIRMAKTQLVLEAVAEVLAREVKEVDQKMVEKVIVGRRLFGGTIINGGSYAIFNSRKWSDHKYNLSR